LGVLYAATTFTFFFHSFAVILKTILQIRQTKSNCFEVFSFKYLLNILSLLPIKLVNPFRTDVRLIEQKNNHFHCSSRIFGMKWVN